MNEGTRAHIRAQYILANIIKDKQLKNYQPYLGCSYLFTSFQ